MIDCNLNITLPSGEIGFVENKRSFVVEGDIDCKILPEDTSLLVKLIDKNKKVVRWAQTNKKNKETISYYPGLTCYREELDPKRKKMLAYGFPILNVKDLNDVNASINNATIKAWYSDSKFKAIIVNASNLEHGSLLNYDFDLLDENNNPYDLLEMGEYSIEVSMYYKDIIDTKITKKIIIGKRENQIICRFNPDSHKQRMIKWCKQNGFAIIDDLLPGYLNPYLGKWYYHMGLLKTYNANDICLFEDTHIRMFVYLIDETSTSYKLELAYLQTQNCVNDITRFTSYYYDIGEASLVCDNKIINANILEFKESEYIHIYRIDIVDENAKENIYYLDQRNVKKTFLDMNNIVVKTNDIIAITGVIKPIQLNKDDFILNELDNTYEINNYPNTIKYTITIDGTKEEDIHCLNMERIEYESIGKSVFEFYNIMKIKPEWKNKIIDIDIECFDNKNNPLKAKQKMSITIK